jgi:YVTN family beta-propeller protein
VDALTRRQTIWARVTAPVSTLDSSGGQVWGTLVGVDTIFRVDPARRNGYLTGSVGHGPAQALEVGGRLFVTSRNDNQVFVLDPRTLHVLQGPVGVGLNPFGLAALGRSVYVTGLADDSVTRIDTP